MSSRNLSFTALHAVFHSPALEGFPSHIVSIGVKQHVILVPTPLHHYLYAHTMTQAVAKVAISQISHTDRATPNYTQKLGSFSLIISTRTPCTIRLTEYLGHSSSV